MESQDNQHQLRALITGATGYIGSLLAAELCYTGWEVHILVRGGSSLERIGADIRVHPIEASLPSISQAVHDAKPDMIFHLASLFIAEHNPEDTSSLVESNLHFGTLLLEAAKATGVKNFVNAGTSWEYWKQGDTSPSCLYAATKRAFGSILDYYASSQQMRVISLTIFDTYGPNDHRGKLVSKLVEIGLSGETIDMSLGEQEIDLVFASDVINGFTCAAKLLLSEQQQPGGCQRYDLSSGYRISLRELAKTISKLTAKPMNINWGAREYRLREVFEPYNINETLPGWEPRTSLDQGLKKLIENQLIINEI